MNIPPNMLSALVGLSILVGLAQCFFGYRIFRLILGVSGFLIGGAIAGGIGLRLSGQEGVAWLSGLVGGLLGAALAVMLMLLGVFLIGAFFGSVLTGALYASTGQAPDPIVVAMAAIAMGALALAFQKLMITFSTAFGGAASVVAGVAHFTIDSFDKAYLLQLIEAGETQLYILLGSWLVLGVVGALVQLGVCSGRRAWAKSAT